MAVKDRFDGVEWTKWAEDIRLRWANAMDYYRRELYYDIEFQQYMQYQFYLQWNQLKTYANERGIQLVGDIPIYVAMDSADTWAHPELFQLDADNLPLAVAGCPPDGFSADGQLWGKSAVPLGLSPGNRISVVGLKTGPLFPPLRCRAHRPFPRI